MGIDIFDLVAIAKELNLADRQPEVDTDEWWAGLNTSLPQPTYRQYSMDRGGPGIMGGEYDDGGVATLPPICQVPNCDSILTVSDGGRICRQCKLEGLGL